MDGDISVAPAAGHMNIATGGVWARAPANGEDPMSDRDLYVTFAREGSSETFGDLARRHAPMVHAVRLRLLGDAAEAEDAALAVFLVFWRTGAVVSDGATVGAWLHRAAELTARSRRKVRARRRRHEWEAAKMKGRDSTVVTTAKDEAIREHIDAAVAALPLRQREVIVLHYLEGRAQVEIAEELGVHVKTVAQRLRGALEALRGRLGRRGGTISGAVLATWLAERSVEPMPAHLLTSITAACAGGAAAGPIAEAAEGVLKTLAWGKMKVAAATLAAATFAASGMGVYLSMAGVPRTSPAPGPTLARAPANPGPVELIDATTPWRACLVNGFKVLRKDGALTIQERGGAVALDPAAPDEKKAGLSPMPPTEWMKGDFDDRLWARYQSDDLNDFLGHYGVQVGNTWPALLCLRTCFGIADPAKAADVKVAVTCIGGGVVYVNGQEVGRGYMPEGQVYPLTPADNYPIDAYTTEDGTTVLPMVQRQMKPDAKWLDRYEKRLRSFTVSVPSRALVKGRNVLAIALHRSAIAGPLDSHGRNWSHLGLRDMRLTSATGAGVVPYAESIKGTRLWSAQAEETVAETVPEKSVAWSHGTVGTGNVLPVRGTAIGNPHDPVFPVRILVPRNGVGSGQAVLSDPAGLKGVTARAGEFQGPSSATIPSPAVQIRFASSHPGVHYCDALMEQAPEGAKTVPIWVIVRAPKNAAPGWYVSSLNLAANGKTFTVPVQVYVSGFAVPDAKDFGSTVCAMHSLDAPVKQYNVEPLSDAHFKLMEKSIALMGQVGNDVLHVPVLTKNWCNWGTPLIRFVKAGDNLKPDFSVLEKYLDLYLKYCAPPKALSLFVWDSYSNKEVADVYEGRKLPSRSFTPRHPPTVWVWDPATGIGAQTPAPFIGEEGSETFYKPLVDGVREIVKKRGWSERIVMLALGGDVRPSVKTGEILRQWAPYARWYLDSHFSGDPSPDMVLNSEQLKKYSIQTKARPGQYIVVGDLEVGVKQSCGVMFAQGYAMAEVLEKRLGREVEFLDMFCTRGSVVQTSAPLRYRTLPLIHMQAGLGDLGLDFWAKATRASPPLYSATKELTAPGPAGAVPTVRFQMLREGVQEWEARMAIVKALKAMPEERRKAAIALLDENIRRFSLGFTYLSQHELGWDYPAYVARIYQAAAEVSGAKSGAKWEAPPR
jgi:RNA polymerase sigma factor (sigma-70 family)